MDEQDPLDAWENVAENAKDALDPREYRWSDLQKAKNDGWAQGFLVAAVIAAILFWMSAGK